MQRKTIQRQIILDTLKNFSTHPTVDELYLEIQKIHPAISKTTIYRNLRQLAQGGEIGQVALTNDVERYDKRTEHHYHFQCKECKALFDVDVASIQGINEKVEEKHGFQVDEHNILFKGICLRCKKNQ
jgi:Fe2+/Zn2+ uptake regulation proteins